MRQGQRFNASVTPVRYTSVWGVRVEISDDAGTLIDRMDIDEFVFATSQTATDAGWRVAESLIRRRSAPAGGTSFAA